MNMNCKNGHEFTTDNTYLRPDNARGCRECLKEAVRTYRVRHPERAAECAARYRENTREERNAYARQYCKSNPDKFKSYRNKRRALKTQAGGSYTVEQWVNLCTQYGNVCLCCDKPENLTPDHVVPIALGGTSDISNIQPLCLPCNLKKHTRTTDFRELRKRS